jgi:predicted DNA-binding protein
MKTDQFLLRPSVELIEKLKALADRYSKSSGQQVAVEIIEQYVDFWEEAEEAKQAVIKRQRAAVGERVTKSKGGTKRVTRKRAVNS